MHHERHHILPSFLAVPKLFLTAATAWKPTSGELYKNHPVCTKIRLFESQNRIFRAYGTRRPNCYGAATVEFTCFLETIPIPTWPWHRRQFVTPLWTWRSEFLNLAYPRPILSKFYSILILLTYCELKLVPLQSGYDVTHLSSDRCYTPKIYIYI